MAALLRHINCRNYYYAMFMGVTGLNPRNESVPVVKAQKSTKNLQNSSVDVPDVCICQLIKMPLRFTFLCECNAKNFPTYRNFGKILLQNSMRKM